MNREKLQEVQSKTLHEMLQVLDEYGMCNVVRPTGFGKTKTFMDYINMFPESKFLYIYDMQSVVEDINSVYAPKNVEFVSYSRLSMKNLWATTKAWIYSHPWHTIIFDESHLMGGENISMFVKELIVDTRNFGIRILGGTATPFRPELYDVTERFFEGHHVSDYTVTDAIHDGILLDPYWVITVHLQQLLAQLRVNANNDFQTLRINQLDRAYAKLLGVSNVYRSSVEEVYGYIPNRMQFLAFYPTIDSLNDGKDQILSDFSKAFPEHCVELFAISSDPEHYGDIVSLKSALNQECEKYVSIILAVDMLNQSYHSTEITGLILNRATGSNRIFTQQLGRGLSVMATNRVIVFDNVGNAKISPDAFLQGLKDWDVLKGYKPRGIGKAFREHADITVHVQPEVLEALEWAARISSTQSITESQIAYAKVLRERHNITIPSLARFLSISEDDAKWVVMHDL